MSCSKPKHQHVDHTLKEKLQILNKLECGMKAIDVCKAYKFESIDTVYVEEAENKVKGHGGCRKSS